jgi:ABC-type antimicrobial peptide transport system permease subunit
MPESTGNETTKKVSLSIREMFDLSLKSIRRRPIKTAYNIATIILGTSFLTFITLASIVLRQYTEASISIETYQYWLAFISLLLCVMSIANSMAIAVLERSKEIGIMKCMGALDRHILLLFFTESTVMSLAGGILGFLFGGMIAAVTYGLQLGFDVVSKVSPFELLSTFGLSVIVAIAVSISATVYPACKAAKARPTEAFKVEV